MRLKTGGEIGGVYIVKQQQGKKTAEYQIVQLFFRFFRNHVEAFEQNTDAQQKEQRGNDFKRQNQILHRQNLFSCGFQFFSEKTGWIVNVNNNIYNYYSNNTQCL